MERDLRNASEQRRDVGDAIAIGGPIVSVEGIVSQREVQATVGRFRAVVEVVGDMLWITDSTGVILEEKFLPGNNSLKGKNFLELFHPADRERVGATWGDAIAHGRTYELEGHVQHEGAYCLCLIRGAPVRGVDGHIREWVNIGFDITHSQQ